MIIVVNTINTDVFQSGDSVVVIIIIIIIIIINIIIIIITTTLFTVDWKKNKCYSRTSDKIATTHTEC